MQKRCGKTIMIIQLTKSIQVKKCVVFIFAGIPDDVSLEEAFEGL